MFLALAFKNLWRNWRRTLLAESSIVFGVIVIVFTGNFIYGMERDWARFEIESDTGAFHIEHRDYRDQRKSEPLKVTVEDGSALVNMVANIPGVRAAYGKLNFSGMVSSGYKSTFFEGVGVDNKRQKTVLNREEYLIVDGTALNDLPGGVILGSDLAAMLGIKIGDPVSIVVRTFHGGLNLVHGTLVGTKNGRHFPSSTYLEMNLAEAQSLLRVRDRVSQVVVGTADFDSISKVMSNVATALHNDKTPFVLRGYPELIPIYAGAIGSFKLISMVVGFVLFLLVGGGIGNVMAMAVMERKREIGTIRALGMEKSQVRSLFLAEGCITGGIGAVVGLVLVTGLTQWLAMRGGFQMPPPPGTHQGFAIIPQINPTMSIFGLVMPFIVGMFAAWWPASTSANLNPVDALAEA